MTESDSSKESDDLRKEIEEQLYAGLSEEEREQKKLEYKKALVKRMNVENSFITFFSFVTPILAFVSIFFKAAAPFLLISILALFVFVFLKPLSRGDTDRIERRMAKMQKKRDQLKRRKEAHEKDLKALQEKQKEFMENANKPTEKTWTTLNDAREGIFDLKTYVDTEMVNESLKLEVLESIESFGRLFELFKERKYLMNENIYIMETYYTEFINAMDRYKIIDSLFRKNSVPIDEAKVIEEDTRSILESSKIVVDNLVKKILTEDSIRQQYTKSFFEMKAKELESENKREFDPSSLQDKEYDKVMSKLQDQIENPIKKGYSK